MLIHNNNNKNVIVTVGSCWHVVRGFRIFYISSPNSTEQNPEPNFNSNCLFYSEHVD